MANRTAITITGVKELKRAFLLLPAKLAKKVIRQSIRQAMKPVQMAAQQAAPVGETGQLRKNIKIRAIAKRKRGMIGIEVRVGKGDFVGDQYYAAFKEYGTAKMPADPYMRPTFDSRGPGALRLAINLIRAGIEREAAALRRG